MATILVIAVILACIAGQVIWGSIIRSFAIFMSAVLGMLVAFNFFDPLALKLIESDFMPWRAHGIVLGLLFVLSFAVFVAVSLKLLGTEIAFSRMTDRIGGAIVGIPTGLLVSGMLVTAISLASGSGSFPYQRFDPVRPDIENPKGVFLNADGFAAGLFGFASSGSLAGDNSFALVRADFANAAAFDRLSAEKGGSPLAGRNAIQLPVVIRLAGPEITDADGRRLQAVPGSDLFLARVNMTRSVIGKDSPNFTLGQLRLICKRKDDMALPGAGTGICVYPVGYLRTSTRLQMEPLSTLVPIATAEFEDGIKPIDVAFYIPSDLRPALVGFKRNFVTSSISLVTPEEAQASGLLPVGFERSLPAMPQPSEPQDPNL
ncbi:MAG TPA: CvpA family protein [Sedimentisphaerales bacterium]|nr:CvpA family protein [Sedimentisphaerales bacterium]